MFNFLLIFLGGCGMDIKVIRFGYGWTWIGFFAISRPTRSYDDGYEYKYNHSTAMDGSDSVSGLGTLPSARPLKLCITDSDEKDSGSK